MLYSRIEGKGKPLVIIHGFMGTSDNWKTLGGQYTKAGFQVHAIDLRNHGKSFHSDDFTYNAMVNDVVEYCRENALDHISVIGHSMGGKVAMFLAVKYPKLIDKLIIADIGPKYYAPHHQDILAGLNAVDFSLKPGRAEVEEVLERHIPDFGTRQFLMKNLHWAAPGQLAWKFNLNVFNKEIDNIGEALPEGSVYERPVLFLRGDRSNYIKDEDIAGLKAHFPEAEIKDIAHSGHWLHAENPQDFLKETIAWLTTSFSS